MSAQQFPLLEPEPPNARDRRGRLDPASEALLDCYREFALAHRRPDSVRGEVSQLRSLVREAQARGGPRTLPELLADLWALRDVLASPEMSPSESTGRRRLRAAETALLLGVSPAEGRRRQDALYELLPKRRTQHWNESPVRVAGSRARRRPESATVELNDLIRIVAAAPAGRNPSQAARNRAVVALYCFSGLRAEEIRALSWSQLNWDPGIEGWRARVERGGRALGLPILGLGGSTLVRWRLYLATDGTHPPDDLVFAGAKAQPLTAQQMRNVVRAATTAEGFSHAGRTELRSAFASWALRIYNLTDHELAQVMGIADLATVDRLLRRQRALDGQRKLALGAFDAVWGA